MTGSRYGTSKLAALGVAEALFKELETAGKADHVQMVTLCPGIVNTALRESSTQVTNGKVSEQATAAVMRTYKPQLTTRRVRSAL